MDKEQLREKIAIAGATAYFELWGKLSEEQRGYWRAWADNQILVSIPDIEKAKREERERIIKHLDKAENLKELDDMLQALKGEK